MNKFQIAGLVVVGLIISVCCIVSIISNIKNTKVANHQLKAIDFALKNQPVNDQQPQS